MPKLKKGQKLICVPCGREIIISDCGVSRTTLWCCGIPMKEPKKAAAKKTAKAKPAAKKKTAKKK